MTLKQLEAFYWAATLASFSLAATRLHLSQSSLSKRIGELETQLGKPLFDRSGHRAVLSPSGQTLLPLAKELLRTVDEITEIMTDEVQIQGVCRFGVGELAALSWLPAFVASARERYPKLVLEPQVDLGRALEEQVESGELDFAVVAGISNRAAVASRVVSKVRFLWAGAPSLLGKRCRLDAELLASVAVITMPSDAGSAREFDHWLSGNGFVVKRRTRCNNLAAIAGLVVAGVGISFLPEAWLRPLVESGELVLIDCEPALPELSYAFQYRRDDLRPLLREMQELVSVTADFSRPNRLL